MSETNRSQLHVEAIRNALNEHGIETADFLNKMALEHKLNDTDTYIAAARILVDAYLKKG